MTDGVEERLTALVVRVEAAAAVFEREHPIVLFLRELSADMHQASTRPCPTCDPLSRKLGWAFGCTAYRQRRAAKGTPG